MRRSAAQAPVVRIAIYDLDRTLVRLPTWTPFLLWAAAKRAPWRLSLAPIALAGALAKKLGLIDRRSLKQLMHRLALGRLTRRDADMLAEGFAKRFDRHITASARARIAADKSEGYRIVIATAAYDFYAEAFGRALGADALVATKVGRDTDGSILPLVVGDNCYGLAKRSMIEEWMRAQGIERGEARLRFYSDHVSDLPTFELAHERFAVNAHGPLRRVAAERGWQLLDWR